MRIFWGRIFFWNAEFQGNAEFIGTIFKGRVGFIGTHFFKDADFERPQFKSNTAFSRSQFDGGAYFINIEDAPTKQLSFKGSSFNGLLEISSHYEFSCIVDLIGTKTMGAFYCPMGGSRLFQLRI